MTKYNAAKASAEIAAANDIFTMMYLIEKDNAARAAEAAKVRKPYTLIESYDPGDGSVKRGRTRRFATLAAAVEAAEKQYFEYKSWLTVCCPFGDRISSVTVTKGFASIEWAMVR